MVVAACAVGAEIRPRTPKAITAVAAHVWYLVLFFMDLLVVSGAVVDLLDDTQRLRCGRSGDGWRYPEQAARVGDCPGRTGAPLRVFGAGSGDVLGEPVGVGC
ncbi:hypothetical protein GCM10010278_61880 [Streptomyces melanogenes]|nr:hypothetical protein GCM10010278_61880 [Streptomyces melanogenes]